MPDVPLRGHAVKEIEKSERADEMNISLTHSLENYLEIIYVMKNNKDGVRVTDLANSLSFSKASVNKAINTLKQKGMVVQEKYGKIILTEVGLEVARSIYEKHKLLSRFLIEVLGVKPCIAYIDACKAEHILSLETITSIKNFLNKLDSCSQKSL